MSAVNLYLRSESDKPASNPEDLRLRSDLDKIPSGGTTIPLFRNHLMQQGAM